MAGKGGNAAKAAKAAKGKADKVGSRRSVTIEDINGIVESLLSSLGGTLSFGDLHIISEIEDLSRYIRSARAEIAALRPDEVRDEFIPTATDELDAIVDATADATNAIMDATEAIEGVIAGVDVEAGESLTAATTRIYEACGFQDITGQRITKVVRTLKEIEIRIDGLIAAFGGEAEASGSGETKGRKKDEDRPPGDEDLLEGPQKPGEGQSQADIDALLASLD